MKEQIKRERKGERKEEEIPLHEMTKRHGYNGPRNLNLGSRLAISTPLFSAKAGDQFVCRQL
jgi:hypothetical protein